jgi:hypothetical protein
MFPIPAVRHGSGGWNHGLTETDAIQWANLYLVCHLHHSISHPKNVHDGIVLVSFDHDNAITQLELTEIDVVAEKMIAS